MRSTFMGLELSTRGIMSAQKALDIVGNNVANVGVTGYTRQRIDIVSMNVNTAYGRYGTVGTALAGQGSRALGVSQIRDSYLDKRFREESADQGYFSGTHEILSDIEEALNEIYPASITDALAKLENAWSAMQGEGAQSDVTASAIMSASRTVAQVFGQLSTKLNNVQQQQTVNLSTNVEKVNSLISQIQNINKEIVRDVAASYGGELSYYGPNELMDSRNVLIDELSQYMDITVAQGSNGGVTITAGNDQHKIIDGASDKLDYFDQVQLRVSPEYGTVATTWRSTGDNAEFGSGSLKASVELLNGAGAQANFAAGEGMETGVRYYQNVLNQFASTFATAFNSVVPEYDENGVKTNKILFEFGGDGERTAANIKVSDQWLKNPTYLIQNAHPEGEGQEDTTFVTNAMAIFTSDQDFGGLFKGDFNEYVQFYTTSQLGADIDYAENCLTSSDEICESLLKSISSVSGVSLEEEGIDMTQWTNAYNAMARIMTAFDDMLDKLINSTGRVGL